jgi:hypothetical protein
MVKCGVYFAVRTEFLNIIWPSFGFKGLEITSGAQTYYKSVWRIRINPRHGNVTRRKYSKLNCRLQRLVTLKTAENELRGELTEALQNRLHFTAYLGTTVGEEPKRVKKQ